jgi:hypothetical protein
MSRKDYDSLLDEWSASAELVVHQWFRESGYPAERHPNGVFKEDVSFVSHNGERWIAEVERMEPPRWARGCDPFRYGDIDLVKERRYGQGILHIQVSADMSKGIVSFPEDHLAAPIEEKNTKYDKGRKGEFRRICLERTMLVDFACPIAGSIAEMNFARTSRLVEAVRDQPSYRKAKRALVGGIGEPFRSPFGVPVDQWREWVAQVDMFLYRQNVDPARRSHGRQLRMNFLS